MAPQFASAELNHLLQLELAEGPYRSSEEALLAGLKALRDSREFHSQVADRLASLKDSRAIVLEGDKAMGEFLDSIDVEMDSELQSQPPRIA